MTDLQITGTTRMANWKDLLREHGPEVWRISVRLLGNRADAEECFQETFLSAFRLSQRQTVDSWAALLHRLAVVRSVDGLRRRYRAKATSGQDGSGSTSDLASLASPEPGPWERLVASELGERLRNALAVLPGKQADAFCLHAISGWSHRDVGAHLGMRENAVSVAIHRARHRLRELMGEPLQTPCAPRLAKGAT